MGTNRWESDINKEVLVAQALKFADDVKEKGIAELQNFWLAFNEKILWCTWKTNNLEGLQAAFDEMNKQSGLKSELRSSEIVYLK